MKRLLRMAGRGAGMVLLAAVASTFVGQWLVLAHQYGRPLLLWSLIAALLPAPFYIGIILWLDRHEREPGRLLVTVFLWGALVAAAIAGVVNTVVGMLLQPALGDNASAVTAVLSAPVIEELSKGAILFWLFVRMRLEFDSVLDGIVYGALVGLGFAIWENIDYFVRYSPGLFGGGLAGLGAMFYVRVILFGFGHSMFTGMTGAALGYARQTPYPLARVLAPATGLAAAIFLHAIWNASGAIPGLAGITIPLAVQLFALFPIQVFVVALPGLLTLIAIAYLAWVHEVSVIRDQLKDEVETGAVTQRELAVIVSARARQRQLLRTLRGRGLTAWLSLRRLYDLQTELAFRKWHVQRGERPTRAQQQTPEDAYRQQIQAVRQRLTAMDVATA
ncbi:MAG: PrsW family intramembrane metalloprotease [Gemmatimonadetes bacterium]|nr:PrsW family intramembrane metalloprotease [Gemmatimonadota bacterium]